MNPNDRSKADAGQFATYDCIRKYRGDDSIVRSHRSDQAFRGAALPIVAREPAGNSQGEHSYSG